jgi:hypothetical protein
MERPENINLNEAEWERLSEEEQQALAEDDSADPAKMDDERQKAELRAGADEELPEDDKTDKAAAAEPAASAPKAEGEAKAGEEPAAADAAAPPAERDRPDFVPQLPVGDARDFDAEEAALVKKYEEGEIAEAEYRKQLRAIGVAEAETRTATTFNSAVREQVWKSNVDDYISQEGKEHYKPGSIMYAALGRALDLLGPDADKENWSDKKLLAEADKRVMSEFGVKPGVPPAPPPAAPKPAPRKSEADARKLAPTTLNEIPAADLPTTGNDKWEAIDRLADSDPTGEAYERALARLSPEDQAAYLARA